MMKLAAAAAGMVTVGAWLVRGQDATQRNPSKTTASGESADSKMDAKQAKMMLEQNQKDMKKNIERLFELASELKEEVEKTDATTTLSIAMLRKTEEIEKLARSIRDRAKG
jgi:hypothetical protein